MHRGAALSVDDIVHVLAGGAARPLGPGVPVTQLDHSLQTAAILRQHAPDDVELALAGLVHDVGQLLSEGSDETHAADGAAAVRGALGERVAEIVALHVEAKRYLVATEGNYMERLTDDSVVSLERQGGAFGAVEAASFLARPWARDAVRLRRADDWAKVVGLEVGGLSQWVCLLRQVSDRGGSAHSPERNERGV